MRTGSLEISVKRSVALAALLLAASTAATAADPAENRRNALTGGVPNLDFRLRYENVDQDNPLRNANAFTVRTRIGYTTGKWNDLDIVGEYEGVVDLSEDAYNSTRNGQPGRSVVADPASDELNQAYIRYSGLPATVFKLGRQRLIYDNARYFGNVGWRQNEQTFDAFSVSNATLAKTTFNYAYLAAVRSITATYVDANANLLNFKYAWCDQLALTGYGYFLDFKLDPAVPPAVSAKHDAKTIGLRATGTVALAYPLIYAAEYARQSRYQDSPSTVAANYLLAEVGSKFGPVGAKLGYEELSGDGTYGFQTPFATGHAFQGWADVFLTTPNTGIRDFYASLSGSYAGFDLLAAWHDFQADSGGAHYGSELDLQAVYPLFKGAAVGAKYADYDANSFAVDTQKIWAWFEFKF